LVDQCKEVATWTTGVWQHHAEHGVDGNGCVDGVSTTVENIYSGL
jgi:hypothetical protein